MKKLLAVLLTLVMCIPCFGAISFTVSAAATEHVYMIVTNPGEDMDTQMNISWHADYTYTDCYVEYTTADDSTFAKAKKANGSYDDDDYKWFMDRSTTIAIGPNYFNAPFLNYGAELSGLTPDTDYIYRICDGQGGYSEVYSFKTAGQDEFSVLWTSDMHLSNETTATETMKRTKYQAVIDYLLPFAKYDVGLHFNTGDVVASGDRYGFWQAFYDFDIMKDCTYAATVGNHDLFDSMMDDDPDYTSFWASSEYFRITANYPKNGYTQSSARIGNYLTNNGYSSYAGEPTDALFEVSEGALAGKLISGAQENTDGKAYWFIYNKMLFIVFDYYAMTWNAEIGAAFDWAYEVIEQNKGKYDYLVAAEHLNIWWGQDGTSRYYDRYETFLNTANVDLFFCGDNHIYFRTDALANGAVTTDPEKGTYFLQAPAVTNTGTYPDYSGAVGVGVNRYASADYLGGAMINVDADGMHFTVATGTGDGSNLAVYDTFTIPKKVRYADATVGIYELGSDLPLYETTELTSTVLKTIPASSVVEVYEVDGIWGKIRYNGMSGWTRLTDAECLYAMDVPSTHAGIVLDGGYNTKYSAEGAYAYTPAYGATIANGGWSFKFNYVFIATEQADGSYTITSINKAEEAKNTTPTSADTVVIMTDNKTGDQYADILVEGYNFTLDWAQNMLNSTDATEEAPVYEFCTVTYYGKDEAYIGENKVLKGHAANALEAPKLEGLTFTGWDKDLSAVSEDMTVTAQYEVSKYTVTFLGKDGVTLSTETVIHGESATAPTAPEIDGFTFEGWDAEFDVVGSDLTVNAIYKEMLFELGDVNMDGRVTNLDAALVLRYDARLIDEIENGDVNKDGKTTSLDAALILQLDAGLIDKF